MDKRALIAIVLSVLVLYVYQSYLVPVAPVVETSKDAPLPVNVKSEGIVSHKDEKKTGTALDEVNIEVQKKAETEIIKTIPSAVTIETEDFIFKGNRSEAVFSNIGGGGLKSLKLTGYRQTIEKSSQKVDRVSVGDEGLLPLSLSFKGNIANLPVGTVFEVTQKGDKKVVYSWSSGNGLRIEKKYLLYPDSYRIDVELTIENGGEKAVNGDLNIYLYEKDTGEKSDRYNFREQIVRVNGGLEKKYFEDINKDNYILEGDISWLALEDKYFITAVIPGNNKYQKRVISNRVNEDLISSSLQYVDISLQPGEKEVITCSVFSGPKDIYLLKEMGADLDAVIDLGWFHVIAEPLLRFLKIIYSFTGNYGYAIILVTLLIKIVFFPLANKSYKSMKDMQKLQPKMAELKEKYKDEKEKMSREMMGLYKKNRVNPLSGCLPMVVQIPVFIALYNVLMNAIELRHAPFHLWITDMSTKDPYYVTPLLMGITMFLQQKMSPSVPDPTQQKVMMLMPVIFIFMFMNLPSGLVLYWLVNNVLSIAQQYHILKK